MSTPQFQKTVENFVCENCESEITGDGYTNHCSKCLWSKHVDINPGDRANTCQGLMEPTNVELEEGEYILSHTCKKCGYQKRNKVSAKDDFDEVVKLAVKFADQKNNTPTDAVARGRLGAGQQIVGNFALGS